MKTPSKRDAYFVVIQSVLEERERYNPDPEKNSKAAAIRAMPYLQNADFLQDMEEAIYQLIEEFRDEDDFLG